MFTSEKWVVSLENMLIREGRSGKSFKVIRDGEIVWNYNSPYTSDIKRYEASSPEIAGRLGNAV